MFYAHCSHLCKPQTSRLLEGYVSAPRPEYRKIESNW